MALLGAPVLGFVIKTVLQSQGSRFLPPVLFSAIGETVNAVTTQILRPVLVEGAILGFLGLLMLLAALFVARKSGRV